ncbi:MAG: CRISPR-associated helicase Cas3' [Leptospiraceae bacterium]|nr:CRISPR-associated helicase Cas3' [Leptospiraceae bacterium]
MGYTTYIAHLVRDDKGAWREHLLIDHLCAVAELAKGFCAKFSAANMGYVAGLWHDLGKYQNTFQERIRKLTGYDVDEEGLSGSTPNVDHSSAGGILAAQRWGLDHPITYAILGHHCGLQDREDVKYRIENKKDLLQLSLQNADEKVYQSSWVLEKPCLKAPDDVSFFYRMLFSALVDADRLDTEKFCEPEKSAIRQHGLTLEEYDKTLDTYLEDIEQNAPNTKVNQLRKKVRSHVVAQAKLEPGFFSLTVPTGGGKTLTSLSFALKHAVAHKKDRVIYAIPYTTIIEQTADVFRGIFGEDKVFEHHSAVDPQKESLKNRLLAENWDFPLIVTTNVQFFESLFSANPSQCRKLHNIVNSVVILDEVQTLPLAYLKPIIVCLKALVNNFRVSVIFCTATQPALSSQNTADMKFKGIDNIRELAPDVKELFSLLKRVEIRLPEDLNQRQEWAKIAEELEKHRQVLCIVNSRKDARDLFKCMPQGTIHLSALMCPAHRSHVIQRLKEQLANGEMVRVISTQLIEAGVDIDFPVVYRALSGIDSIVQSAGRCNREGKLPELGKVYIFVPPSESPRGHLRMCERTAKAVIEDFGDPLAMESYKRYYEELIWKRGDGLDEWHILEKMRSLQFAKIYEEFQMINNDGISVLVPYGKGKHLMEELMKASEQTHIRALLREATRFMVDIPRASFINLQKNGCARFLHDAVGVIERDDLYDESLGLLLDDPFYYKVEGLII